MDINDLTDIFREGIFVVLKIGGPMLVLSMIVGVTISIFQAVTQVHEQTLSFAFKLAAIGGCIFFGGQSMMDTLVEYTDRIFLLMRTG